MIVDRCPWYIAGPLLGLLIVALRATVNKPLGALGGYVDLVQHVTRPRALGFSAFLLAGIVLGGFMFAIATGGFAARVDYDASNPLLPGDLLAQSAVLLIAGMAIGAGARIAGGCTSGHGLCGVSLGSSASMVATLTFFATAVALAQVWSLIGGTP